MQKVMVECFLVSGIKTRTNNKNEQNLNTAKIAKLWQNFYSHEIIKQISNNKNTQVYGVYSSYESDVNSNYDVLVGVEVLKENENFENILIEKGNFLLFQKSGNMPQAAIECWQEIWDYFQTSQEQRAYKVDFEKYIDENNIQIYISIK